MNISTEVSVLERDFRETSINDHVRVHSDPCISSRVVLTICGHSITVSGDELADAIRRCTGWSH